MNFESVERAEVDHGGATLDLHGHAPKTGYAVACDHRLEKVSAKPISPAVLADYISRHWGKLESPGKFLGLWDHGSHCYLDVVTVEPDLERAIALARQHGQLAIYDLAHNCAVRVCPHVRRI